MTCTTSPMILVVRMSRDTEGPNKLPGKSRLTLLRSNTGMLVVVVACFVARHDDSSAEGAPGNRLRATVASGPDLRPRDEVPLCRQHITRYTSSARTRLASARPSNRRHDYLHRAFVVTRDQCVIVNNVDYPLPRFTSILMYVIE